MPGRAARLLPVLVTGLLVTGAAAGCAAQRRSEPMVPGWAMERLAVCSVQTSEMAGSLTPLGNGLAVSAGHLIREEAIHVNFAPARVDVVAFGGGIEAMADDWVVLRVHNVPLPAPNALAPRRPLRRGDAVYVGGFPGGQQTVYLGHVVPRPFWVRRSQGLVFLSIEGAPDLNGASGGPAAVWDPASGWQVVGIYVGSWRTLGWHGYAIRRLPEESFPAEAVTR